MTNWVNINATEFVACSFQGLDGQFSASNSDDAHGVNPLHFGPISHPSAHANDCLLKCDLYSQWVTPSKSTRYINDNHSTTLTIKSINETQTINIQCIFIYGALHNIQRVVPLLVQKNKEISKQERQQSVENRLYSWNEIVKCDKLKWLTSKHARYVVKENDRRSVWTHSMTN